MIVERQASAIIFLSVFAGLVLSPLVDHHSLADEGFQLVSDGEGFEYGTAHEHAMFYIVVNGSEKDLTSERFQLQEDYVHLEGNRSNIVHKHAEGVEWKDFLETINTSIDSGEEFCIELYAENHCGDGKAVLNGVEDPDLSREITQGDSFLVIVETENMSDKVDEYMKRQLPRVYKPSGSRGKRV